MKIIIAPTKKMDITNVDFKSRTKPALLDQTKKVLKVMQSQDYDSMKTIWHTSEKLAQENFRILKNIDLTKNLAPAITSFVGIQYQYMAPDLFTAPALNYIQDHLRILSGFYGVLRPFDAITNYRLEMESKLPINAEKNLYYFWGNKIYDALKLNKSEPIINLASEEYSKAVRPYLTESQVMIDIVFAHKINDKLKVKATLAKMARGEMVRFMAENNIKKIDDLKNFPHPNYKYSQKNSSPSKLVFIAQ